MESKAKRRPEHRGGRLSGISSYYRRRKGWKLILNIIVLAYILLINPFHVLDLTTGLSATVVHRLVGVLGAGIPPQPDLSVVDIDDQSVYALGPTTGYPLDFNVHARLLNTIMCAGPSAIFIDIALQAVRPDYLAGQTEQEAIEMLASAMSAVPGSPACAELAGAAPVAAKMMRPADVFLAFSDGVAGGCGLLMESDGLGQACTQAEWTAEFGANVHAVRIARTNQYSSGFSYPLLANSTNTTRFNDYVGTDGKSDPVAPTSPSPALALVLARCDQGVASSNELEVCQTMAPRLKLVGNIDIPGEDQLVPNWRFYRIPQTAAQSTSNVVGNQESSCARFQIAGPDGPTQDQIAWNTMRAVIDGFAGTFSDAMDSNLFGDSSCVPYNSISAKDLIMLEEQCSEGRGCEDMRRMFGGRSVIYGYSAHAGKDFVKTPVFGNMAGLYQHAAATETLMTEGSGYRRLSIPVRILGHDIQFDGNHLRLIFLSVYVLVLAVINPVFCHRDLTGSPRSSLARHSGKLYWFALGCMISISIALSWVLPLPIFDVIGCVMLTLTFLPTLDDFIET